MRVNALVKKETSGRVYGTEKLFKRWCSFAAATFMSLLKLLFADDAAVSDCPVIGNPSALSRSTKRAVK